VPRCIGEWEPDCPDGQGGRCGHAAAGGGLAAADRRRAAARPKTPREL